MRCLDKQPVGTGLEVHFGAPQRVVESVHRPGVGAGDDKKIGAFARIHRRAQLRRHHIGLDHILACHVTATFGRALVLHEDRRHTHRLIAGDGTRDVLGVAVAVIAVDQHRETARRHNVADAGAHLAEAYESDIR